MKTIEKASKYSIYNKKQIENSSICGCYNCLKIFKPDEIKEWIDKGATAMCPYCGIDSILGDASEYEISKEILEKLNKYWF